jgi:N-acetylneuraminic acid mutarotase
MSRCRRLRAPASFLIATSLGVFAAAQTPALAAAAPGPQRSVTLATAPKPVVPDATLRSLLAKHLATTSPARAEKVSAQLAAAAGVSPLCSASTSKLVAECYAIRLNAVTGSKGLRAAATPPAGLSPSDLLSAYNLPQNGGAGATIAIVDAYDDPNAAADLAVYRQQYGLPALSAGQFIKVNQQGVQGNYPQPDSGWSGEISLDLDMVSAIAPEANIILVEANSPSIDDLGAGVNEAVALGAGYVSNSYGTAYNSTPGSGESAQDLQDSKEYYDHPGVAVVAASGDSEYGVGFPAASPYVTAVGGTSLVRDSSTARGWTETAWNSIGHGPGSGCSTIEPKPAFQTDTGCSMRTVADVSAVADPETGVAMYDTYGADGTGWEQIGGTSAATPIITSTYALAGPVAPGTYPNSYPYAHPYLNDVTSGSNGTCDPSYLCTAGPGYDGPTGLGTPNGTSAFADGPTGTLSGTITNASTHAPISGVNVTLTDSADQLTYHATTDSTGAYHITVSPGTYDVSASLFGYGTGTDDGVVVTAGQAATASLALTQTPANTVAGKVTDGSGEGWPLYAKIMIDGVPNGTLYTNPETGAYSVNLPDQASYTMHVTPLYPGYKTPSPVTVTLGTSNVKQDVSVTADTTLCFAPGYGYPAQANFDDWTTGPRDGWTVTSNNGATYGWEFNQPGNWINLTGGTGNFAIADPNDHGGAAEDTDLTSPSFDLTGQKSADLQFDALLLDASGTGEIDASVSTDGGATWTTVYQQNGPGFFQGHVDVPLTQALGHNDVKLRLHYKGQGASLAQLDDVTVGQCQTLGGGLIEGNVIDANTHQDINGATVTDGSAPAADPYAAAVSADTPGARQPDGFYWLYSPKTGSNDATTAAPRYTTTNSTVMVSHLVRHYNPVLQAGQLTVTPGKVSLSTTLGGKASQEITLTNTGRAPIKVTVAEQNQAAPSAAAQPSPAGASWQNLPAYPEPVIDNVVGTYEGKTYSVSGISGVVAGTIYSNGYVYEPGASSWSPIADMPQPRVGAAGAFVDGTLYVVGGNSYDASGDGGGGPAMPTAYAYHPDSNTWSQVADLPEGLDKAAVAVLDGKLYVIGGYDSTGQNVTVAYRYDPAANTWSQIADYPVDADFFGCGGINDTIVCAGGAIESGGHAIPSNSTYVYHPDTNTWTQAPDMPYNEFGASYSSANGELQVVAGFTWSRYPWGGVSEIKTAVQYDPIANVWTDLPSAPHATVRAGSGTGCGLSLIGGTPAGSFFPVGTTGAATLPGFDQCTGDDVSWLSESKTTIELAPGQSTRIRVTADATALAAPGSYAATLSMITDSPYIYQPVPVTLKAAAPSPVRMSPLQAPRR